jgi:hypothetical protein
VNTPSPFQASPFTHLDELLRAYETSTDEADRRLYLRGILRGLAHVVGQAHERLDALSRVVPK